jgi:hypothetical protein
MISGRQHPSRTCPMATCPGMRSAGWNYDGGWTIAVRRFDDQRPPASKKRDHDLCRLARHSNQPHQPASARPCSGAGVVPPTLSAWPASTPRAAAPSAAAGVVGRWWPCRSAAATFTERLLPFRLGSGTGVSIPKAACPSGLFQHGGRDVEAGDNDARCRQRDCHPSRAAADL